MLNILNFTPSSNKSKGNKFLGTMVKIEYKNLNVLGSQTWQRKSHDDHGKQSNEIRNLNNILFDIQPKEQQVQNNLTGEYQNLNNKDQYNEHCHQRDVNKENNRIKQHEELNQKIEQRSLRNTTQSQQRSRQHNTRELKLEHKDHQHYKLAGENSHLNGEITNLKSKITSLTYEIDRLNNAV